jgi:hypothetical protein
MSSARRRKRGLPRLRERAAFPASGGAAVKRPSAPRFPGGIIARMTARRNARVKDSTEVLRTRESIGRNKLTLMICALLAAVGFIGWLTSL